ncbi:hypothetical protein Kpol_1065p20 [Vanderwaltozyma polyspora DSM 70294]|uniref:FeS cluster biogenesis domain-containing protein n=1 Tax=Vanderwaltozyma polyspora (strain ATCC 22028 / DSM 70294 / BCRC 21397 / CBS 2163 / NBRC 10782 / NRRL Y-8283 / UCD 57-17) TaxID=436907 RepID=A7TL42_VANPO|nr:uncharacterized protein Kpol_1065p20 [Vanderwaltozyma polyspora DSM 70294]EDO17005.1 hypothetical protein Kpol_1065p20 [Vanderwaltozyma polyspora DSM 70294]
MYRSISFVPRRASLYLSPRIIYQRRSIPLFPVVLRNYSNTTSNESIPNDEPLVTPLKIINGNPKLNLKISERAARRLSEINKTSNEALQISVESGGCHGFQYNLKLIPKTEVENIVQSFGNTEQVSDSKLENSEIKEGIEDEDDNDLEFDSDDVTDNKMIVFIIPENDTKILIDEKSLTILNNTYLTYTKELIGSSFKILGGSLKSSCGCGSSFDIDH